LVCPKHYAFFGFKKFEEKISLIGIFLAAQQSNYCVKIDALIREPPEMSKQFMLHLMVINRPR
jgi:hypothetical protein